MKVDCPSVKLSTKFIDKKEVSTPGKNDIYIFQKIIVENMPFKVQKYKNY